MVSRSGARGVALTLGVFIGLLAIYQGLIWGQLLPASNGLTQWEDNIIRAERFAYGEPHAAPLVLVGSSLTTNLVGHTDWDDVVNLGQNGGTAQTGLEILRSYRGAPGVVVVELNDTIARGLDGDLLESIFRPGVYRVRKSLPMLRTEYRPVSVLLRVLATIDNQPGAATARRDDPARPRLTPAEQRQRDRSVERAYPKLMEPLAAAEADQIRREAGLIQQQIADLEAAGWRVLLTDVPRDSRLAATTQEVAVRDLLFELFPSDRYRWLPEPPAREWVTRDGSHLVKADAREFGAFLRSQVGGVAATR